MKKMTVICRGKIAKRNDKNWKNEKKRQTSLIIQVTQRDFATMLLKQRIDCTKVNRTNTV